MDRHKVIVIRVRHAWTGVVEGPRRLGRHARAVAGRSARGPKRVASGRLPARFDLRDGGAPDGSHDVGGLRRPLADPFGRVRPRRMNRIPKIVVSRSAPAPSTPGATRRLLEGELVDGSGLISTRKQDVVVMGSTSVVHALAAAGWPWTSNRLLVDAERGSAWASDCSSAPVDLQLTSVETVGCGESWRATTVPLGA